MRGVILLGLGLVWALLGCRSGEPATTGATTLPPPLPTEVAAVAPSATAAAPATVLVTVVVTATGPAGEPATPVVEPSSQPPPAPSPLPPLLHSPAPSQPTATPGPPPPEVCGRPMGWVDHQVGPGDTLTGLAACAGLSPADLMLANCLAGPDLLPGQPLLLPPACETPPPGENEEGEITERPPVVETERPPPPGPGSIAVAPISGPPGTLLTLGLSDFDAGSVVALVISDMIAGNECYRRSVAIDAAGNATHALRVPGFFPTGFLTITATDPNNAQKEATAEFQVMGTAEPRPCGVLPTATPMPTATTEATPTTEPTPGPTATPTPPSPPPPGPGTLIVAPVAGAPGTLLTLSLSDFHPQRAVQLTVRDQIEGYTCYTRELMTGATGATTHAFMLPDTFPTGFLAITAADPLDPTKVATAEFQVLGTAAPGPCGAATPSATPEATIAPAVAPTNTAEATPTAGPTATPEPLTAPAEPPQTGGQT